MARTNLAHLSPNRATHLKSPKKGDFGGLEGEGQILAPLNLPEQVLGGSRVGEGKGAPQLGDILWGQEAFPYFPGSFRAGPWQTQDDQDMGGGSLASGQCRTIGGCKLGTMNFDGEAIPTEVSKWLGRINGSWGCCPSRSDEPGSTNVSKDIHISAQTKLFVRLHAFNALPAFAPSRKFSIFNSCIS